MQAHPRWGRARAGPTRCSLPANELPDPRRRGGFGGRLGVEVACVFFCGWVFAAAAGMHTSLRTHPRTHTSPTHPRTHTNKAHRAQPRVAPAVCTSARHAYSLSPYS